MRRSGQPPAFELQELWFSALRYRWSSLAVVPADRGISSVHIAQALGEMARAQTGGQLVHVVAEGLDMQSSSALVNTMAARRDRASNGAQGPWHGREIIVAVDPVVVNPAGVAVALAADAVLLHVVLGRTNLSSARRTIDLIGWDRFLGCVLEK